MLTNAYLKRVYETVLARNPGESEFHQAVMEVLESLGERGGAAPGV